MKNVPLLEPWTCTRLYYEVTIRMYEFCEVCRWLGRETVPVLYVVRQ